jgi:putative ABC transport system permease protein
MRPNEHELDEEIRAHLAISIRERIDAGEDPEAARLAALREFGYVPAVRESMRRVWYSRWLDGAAALGRDMRIALRSLRRAKGLAATVVITLALGIGANAAIFSVVRGVLLRPLVNRDEDRLIYIRQSAPGIGITNSTFSVPEVNELRSRLTSFTGIGEFSTVEFTVVGLTPEPRVVKAGVVDGSFFDVMGLRPVLGRLLNKQDDGPKAAPAVVLTHRFWSTSLNSDSSVIGKTVRLGPNPATIVGVLEPSVPYPATTELIANVVSSPHHLSAMMVTSRIHRMTELFGRLAPGVTLDQARAELTAVHAAMVQEHPAAYSPNGNGRVTAQRLRDQIASPARTILIVLLAAAAVVFVIACSNVANLILARSVRREGELAVRAAQHQAFGEKRPGTGVLRRTLLAESLVLCGAGAVLGVLIARPLVAMVASYASRFSVRAVEVRVDPSVLWIAAGLAMVAAVLLAYVPRLPSPHAPAGLGLAGGSIRMTPGTNRRLRVFATTQIACSFVLLAGAGMLLATLLSLQRAHTGYEMEHVLAFDIPTAATGVGMGDAKVIRFYRNATQRIAALPGVEGVAVGSFVPWRDAGGTSFRVQFSIEGYQRAHGEEDPRARFRLVAPRFFNVLGIPMKLVAIVSQSIAQRLFPGGDVLNRRLMWRNPIDGTPVPTRVVGVVADVDDESFARESAMTIYLPVYQMGIGGRLFVRVAGDPYAAVATVTRTIRELAPDQPVERAATLADVRAMVLSPERLNAFVFSGFAGIALLISVVGVAGVLAFSVSARTREFGIRMAVGCAPRQLLTRVLSEGALIATLGVTAGAAGGYLLTRTAARMIAETQVPGVLPAIVAAVVLIAAALVASLVPGARASRVDVLQALRSE